MKCPQMDKKEELEKMKAIDNKELILALDELEKEKGIKKEYVLDVKKAFTNGKIID